MTPTETEIAPNLLDADGRVCVDLSCLKCGYNLRSLANDGKCPECGLLVTHSVRGDLLKYSDRTWVRRLATGAALLLAGVIGLAIFALTAFGGAMLYGVGGRPLLSLWGSLLVVGAWSIGVATPLAILIGVLLLTTREPRLSLRPEGLSARRLCRGSLVVFSVLSMIALLVASASGWRLPWFPGTLWVLAMFVLGCGVFPVSLLHHVASLLRRVPAKEHADAAKLIAGGILAVDILLSPLLLVSLFTRGRLGGGMPALAFVALLVGGTCYIAGLLLLRAARKHFRQAAREAEINNGQHE